jgi:hypothetical protein
MSYHHEHGPPNHSFYYEEDPLRLRIEAYHSRPTSNASRRSRRHQGSRHEEYKAHVLSSSCSSCLRDLYLSLLISRRECGENC